MHAFWHGGCSRAELRLEHGFQFANEVGQALGAKVGHYVTERLFYRVGTLPPGVDPDDDAGVPFDAGTGSAGSGGSDAAVADAGARDAGSEPEPDAARPDASRPTPRPDSGSAEPDSGAPYVADAGAAAGDDDDGCSCRVPGSSSGNGGLRSLALIGLALMFLRRRKW